MSVETNDDEVTTEIEVESKEKRVSLEITGTSTQQIELLSVMKAAVICSPVHN